MSLIRISEEFCFVCYHFSLRDFETKFRMDKPAEMRCADLCPASISPYMEGVGLMEDSLEDRPDGFLNLSTAKGPGLGGSVSVM